MSFMNGTYDDRDTGRFDGERVAAPPAKITRYTSADLRKIRAGEMIIKRHEGWHIDDIAAMYKITRKHAYFEIGDFPDWQRALVIEAHRNGKVGMG